MRTRAAALAAAIGLVASCDDPAGLTHGPISAMVVVSGDAQSDTVGQQLPSPIVVRVEDANGNVIPSQIVNFVVVKGGGSVFGGANETNAQGIAQEIWTLGTNAADSQVVEVRAVDNTTGQPKVFGRFIATALASAPTSFAVAAGDNQTGTIGGALATNVVVRLADQHNNPVAGKDVSWEVLEGAGSTVSPQTTTGADGTASSGWALGAWAGITHTLRATVPGFAPVAFQANAALPATLSFTKVAGDAQTDTVALTAADSVITKVALSDGRPVRNASVGFAVASGSGSVGHASVQTDVNGRAGTTWTLGSAAGTQSLTATTSGASNLLFSAAATPGPVAAVTVASGNAQTGPEGQALSDSLVARVTDAHGNRKSLVVVDWSATEGGGAIAGGGATNSSGEARASWTLGQAGAQAARATAAGFHATFSATAVPAVIAAAAVGYEHICIVTSGGVPYCRGSNIRRQLGRTTGSTEELLPVNTTVTFSNVVAGWMTTCGISTSKSAYCWGKNENGELGNGQFFIQTGIPQLVVGGHSFKGIGLGDSHACGLTEAGAAYCWGDRGGNGRLGDGSMTTSQSAVPVAVVGGHVFTTISVGGLSACGLKGNGEAWCWGYGLVGNLGDGNRASSATPVLVSGGHSFSQITVGAWHACGLAAGAAHCWGYNGYGQLGTGVAGGDQLVPTAVGGGLSFVEIAAGTFHTCARVANNSTYCWGSSLGGQLGNGSFTNSSLPVAVAAPSKFSNISASSSKLEGQEGGSIGGTCGVTVSGEVHCWGRMVWTASINENRTSNVPIRLWP